MQLYVLTKQHHKTQSPLSQYAGLRHGELLCAFVFSNYIFSNTFCTLLPNLPPVITSLLTRFRMLLHHACLDVVRNIIVLINNADNCGGKYIDSEFEQTAKSIYTF